MLRRSSPQNPQNKKPKDYLSGALSMFSAWLQGMIDPEHPKSTQRAILETEHKRLTEMLDFFQLNPLNDTEKQRLLSELLGAAQLAVRQMVTDLEVKDKKSK